MTLDGNAFDAALPAHLRDVLLRRAERLREAPPEAIADETITWLATFVLGGETFGLALSALRAVTMLRLVTPVPLSAPHVIGILRFQGQLITAVSLASVLGKSWRADPTILIIVDRGRGGMIALDCGEVPAAATVDTVTLAEAVARTREVLVPVTANDGRALNLIDLDRFVALVERRGHDGR